MFHNKKVYFQATIDDLFGFRAAYRAMDGDFLIASNTERTHRVTSFRKHWRLVGQRFQHLKLIGAMIG